MPARTPLRRARYVLAAALLTASVLPGWQAHAQEAAPGLQLRSGVQLVKARHPKGAPVYLDLGVYVAAVGGPFEVWVTRPDYTQPVEVAQALFAPDGTRTFRPLPSDTLYEDWFGFADFLRIDVSQNGHPVKAKSLIFCPNSYDRQRVNDEGPDTPEYPDSCFSNPFTKGVVWGIDEGWGVNPAGTFGATMRLRDGLYDATVSIDPRYVELLDLPTTGTSVQLQLKVRTVRFYPGCPECPFARPADAMHRSTSAAVPVETDPDPATLPDLQSLPAWGISVQNGRRHEWLSFGATVWTGGAQPMVVEGFRRDGAELMDAYQYFYKDGEPVARAPVGQMEYDTKRGHRHWHFLQFARYSLLDATRTELVRSKKEAFCLSPTDAIDLTLPGAEWAPYLGGLGTACGGPTALWVREVLPLGWGDTYFQGLPGQSFDITGLPNGAYFIEVAANPLGSLYEQNVDNNSEFREVIIGGEPGARTVEVPPWNGIDTEGPFQGGGGEGGPEPHHSRG